MESKLVLVVDDEEEVTYALQAYFMKKGYEMLISLDGLEAMRLLKERKLDLVLLDMKMPGVNGLEVLKFIHTLSPRPKVVVVTAYDVQYQEMVEKIGVDGFLTKPFGVQAMTSMIEQVLEGKQVQSLASAVAEMAEGPALTGPKTHGRLLFVEPSEYTYKLKEVFFRDPESCGGKYEVAGTYSADEALQQLELFHPDILLVELSMLGLSGDLVVKAMHSPVKPKELIIHGSGSSMGGQQSAKVEDLSKHGIKVVLNESFTRAGLVRLNEVIRNAAQSVGLVEEES